MLGLPPLQGPRAVFRDLRAFLGRRSREQTKAALLSLGITGFILVIFFLDARVNTAPPATIAYVESWDANRTDAQIKEDQQKDQAAAEARARMRQEQFKEVANTLGIE
jgi:hypothetical protein